MSKKNSRRHKKLGHFNFKKEGGALFFVVVVVVCKGGKHLQGEYISCLCCASVSSLGCAAGHLGQLT